MLDLDETLIHSEEQKPKAYDFEITIDKEEKYYVRKRPFLQQFLEFLSKYFKIVVYTAANKQYADLILNVIDPLGLISQRLYRGDCKKKSANIYEKDLSKISKDLSKIFLIDNSPSVFGQFRQNGLLIPSYYDDKKD